MLRVLATASLLLCACGGSASTTSQPQPPQPTMSTSRAAGGLIGTIDLARLHAACENVRQADPLVQTGMDMTQADRMLLAAAGLLARPPVDTAAQAVARAVRRDVTAHHETEAGATAADFCRARGG